MKAKQLIIGLATVSAWWCAHGTVFTFSTPGALIPDGNSSGWHNTASVPLSGEWVVDVRVSLTISGYGSEGAYNGDLYAYVEHGGQLVVLLNRVGKDSTLFGAYGYGDNGLAVDFADAAVNGDIHNYQTTLGGAPTGPLTGTWEPDRRTADPADVLPGSPRGLGLLETFEGMEAGGDWTVFVADLHHGGAAQVESWAVELTTTTQVIPEPAWWSSLVALLALGFVLRKRLLG